MSCDFDLINLYIDDMLAADERALLERHAENCSKCASSIAFLRVYKEGLCGINEVPAPSGLLPSVLERVKQEQEVYERPRRMNWRAWGTAAAAVVVAIGVSIALLSTQGLMDSGNATGAVTESAEAYFDAEDISVADAAPRDAAANENDPTERSSSAAQSAAGSDTLSEQVASEPYPAAIEAPASEEQPDAQMPSSDVGIGSGMQSIELPSNYFVAVEELMIQTGAQSYVNENGNTVYIIPDADTATGLHKLLKKLGIKGLLFTAGEEVEFIVY